jgi:putative ABC transport system permease protein
VLGESIVTGLIGGVIGIGIGYAGAFAIDKFAPTLTASSSTSSASNAAGGGPGGGGPTSAASDITVHLTAPVNLSVLALAVGLAVLGGLIAGGLGGWRASSLRPADALSKVA